MFSSDPSKLSASRANLTTLAQLTSRRILVVGDLFLDLYTIGHVARISPEAPIPILSAVREFSKAGGAGNVALNLAAMGNQVSVLGRIGDDEAGESIKAKLLEADTSGILSESGFATATKHRIVADQQQLLRIDTEKYSPLSVELEGRFLHFLRARMGEWDAIAVSDYGKGLCTTSFLRHLMDLAKSVGCPVIVDPKGRDFSRYQGARVLKPNLSELHAAAGLSECATHEAAARVVFSQCSELSWILLTKSSEGMTLFASDGKAQDLPVEAEEIVDVTGAGDTALAALTHSWASGLEPEQCANLANCAAGIAVKHLGCAQVDLKQISQALASSLVIEQTLPSLALISLENLPKTPHVIVIALEVGQLQLHHLQQIVEQVQNASNNRERDEKIAVYCSASALDAYVLHLLASLKEIDFLLQDKRALQRLIQSKSCSEIYTWRAERFELSNPLECALVTEVI